MSATVQGPLGVVILFRWCNSDIHWTVVLIIEETCFSALWLLGFLIRKCKDNTLPLVSTSKSERVVSTWSPAEWAGLTTPPKDAYSKISATLGSSLAAMWGSPWTWSSLQFSEFIGLWGSHWVWIQICYWVHTPGQITSPLNLFLEVRVITIPVLQLPKSFPYHRWEIPTIPGQLWKLGKHKLHLPSF